MFLKIAGAQSAEQSGIKGVKKFFDPNIIGLHDRVNKNIMDLI